MAVKLRLTRVGKTKQPEYRIVAADSRSPRDGRFIEILGHYNPRTDPSTLNVDNDKAVKWLSQGAQPTDRVRKLLEISGALEQFSAAKAPERERRHRRSCSTTAPTTPTAPPHRPRQRSSTTSSARSSTTRRRSSVDTSDDGRRVRLDVRVGPGDLGRVIGRRGRTAQSIRTVVRAAAARDDTDVDIEFLDD